MGNLARKASRYATHRSSTASLLEESAKAARGERSELKIRLSRGGAMPEIRACMFDRVKNPMKVPDKVFNRMVDELKKQERQVCFVGANFRVAYGTTIPEKTEVEGDKIWCGMYVPTRVIKYLESGKVFAKVGFVKQFVMTAKEAKEDLAEQGIDLDKVAITPTTPDDSVPIPKTPEEVEAADKLANPETDQTP